MLSASNKHDAAILDDGFQDFSIKPNFSILCFNSKQMIGNGLIIPAGPLRESLRAIKRADCIIINGNKNLEFENKIFEITKNKNFKLFYSKYKIKNIDKFRNKKITAFAGIGNPSNFFELLKENIYIPNEKEQLGKMIKAMNLIDKDRIDDIDTIVDLREEISQVNSFEKL